MELRTEFPERHWEFGCEADLSVILEVYEKMSGKRYVVGYPPESDSLIQKSVQFDKLVITEELCRSDLKRTHLAVRTANIFQNSPPRPHQLGTADIPSLQPKQSTAE